MVLISLSYKIILLFSFYFVLEYKKTPLIICGVFSKNMWGLSPELYPLGGNGSRQYEFLSEITQFLFWIVSSAC